jgi:hypothetical protein
MSETTIHGIALHFGMRTGSGARKSEDALDQLNARDRGMGALGCVQYLMEQLVPRLERETHILTGMADRLPAAQSGHIWALGELLQFLCRHLCELGTMPQCGPAFADGVTKLLRACISGVPKLTKRSGR